ncbi:AAA family ATPase [Croceiramulus getboli]|nr:ATP-binding protein [Flavobacteriaceae bacterium YJPT1-3]
MKAARILLIGGPSTGKTTLIEHLEQRQFKVYHEVSRQVTAAAQREGIDQLFLTDPLAFSRQLLEARIQQHQDAGNQSDPFVFLDRGIPDVTAYLNFIDQPYPAYFDQAAQEYRYDQVFLLPAWSAIHETDQERYESFEEAQRIEQELLATYERHGYSPIEVPKSPVEHRADFVLEQIDAVGA